MSFYNNERYLDPTAGQAVCNIRREEVKLRKMENGEWQMSWIYIASPYKGDIDTNIMRAKRYCRFVASRGKVPQCPHIFLTTFLDDDNKDEREAGLYLGIQMLKRCNELWVFGSHISEGMKKEIEFAIKRNIPIKYYNDRCEEIIT